MQKLNAHYAYYEAKTCYACENDHSYLGYLGNLEASQSGACDFGHWLMAIHGFSLCVVGEFQGFSIAKTGGDDTFFEGADLANMCRARGGVLGDLFIKKTPKNTKGHFTGPIHLSQSGDM